MILSAHTSNGGPTIARPEPLSTRGMLKLLRKRLREVEKRGLTKNRDGVRDVHRLRVATRKSLAALKVCRPLVPKSTAKRIEQSLKGQRKSLGQLRDWDVLISRVLCTPADEKAEARCDLLLYLARERRRAWTSACRDWARVTESADIGAAIKEIRSSKPKRNKNATVTLESAHELFRRVLCKPLESIRAGLSTSELDQPPEMETLHQLRIAFKELRYLLEFRDAVTQAPSPTPALAIISEAQQRLGDLHDWSRRPELLKSGKRPKSKNVRDWVENAIEIAQARLPAEAARYLEWQKAANLRDELSSVDA